MLASMATAIAAPCPDFVQLWFATASERAVGHFATVRANIEYICQVLQLPATVEEITTASCIRLDYTRRALTPRPAAVETLSLLKDANYKIGLVSDCSEDVPVLLHETPFSRLVHMPIFSNRVGMKKPDQRIYLLVCERLGVEPQACVYIGDGGSRELTGAAQVGMHPVLIRGRLEESADTMPVDAREWLGPCISSLEEVLALIRG